MDKNDFHYVAVLLDQLYGIEMNDEDIEELGLLAWGLIGNRDVRLYRYSANIEPDLSVTLPCNALGGSVEAVTASYEDWSDVTNYSENGDQVTSFIEHQIEAEKQYQDAYYIPGKLLKYQESGDKLYFTHNYGRVNILYKGILADESGLPRITTKEATAIATYIAYVQKYKESLITNNTQIMNQATSLQNLWLKQCDQARVQYLSQNQWNEILQVKGSFDRASYARSYKPIR